MNRKHPTNNKTKAKKTSSASAIHQLHISNRQAIGYDITLSTPIEEVVRPEPSIMLPKHMLVVSVAPEKRSKKHESQKS